MRLSSPYTSGMTNSQKRGTVSPPMTVMANGLCISARTQSNRRRKQSEDGGERRHEDRADPGAAASINASS